AEMAQHQFANSLVIEPTDFGVPANEALRGEPLECGCRIGFQRLAKDVAIELPGDGGEQCGLPVFLWNPLQEPFDSVLADVRQWRSRLRLRCRQQLDEYGQAAGVFVDLMR